MNGNSYKKKSKAILLWTLPQARGAASYLAAVLHSIRETWLEGARKEIYAQRLAAKPGRSDRKRIIDEQQAFAEARSAHERYLEAREELEGLGIATLDPNQGMAWIPFSYENQLAWFVFDLFDSEPIRFWRYQTDPLETRRPVSEIAADASMASWTV
jgi:hypothetical protein